MPATKVITEDDKAVVPGSGQVSVIAYSVPMPVGYYTDTAKTAATFRTIDGIR